MAMLVGVLPEDVAPVVAVSVVTDKRIPSASISGLVPQAR
jgi:hypothetical protein